MTQRAQLVVQILEKLGVPLLSVVNRSGEKDPSKQAEQMASMLTKAVQASLSLSSSTDLRDNSDQADAVKLALTALSSGIVADHYALFGKLPEPGDIDRLLKTLEATLTFADNFTAAPENAIRLETLLPGALPVDETQVNLQYINAFIPVVMIVMAYSFGQPEKKLMQDIAARLTAQAAQLRQSLLPELKGESEIKRAELGLMGGLVSVYIQCHQIEMQRLVGLGEEDRAKLAEGGGLSMDGVWDAFNARVSMLEVLVQNMAPAAREGAGAGTGGAAPAASSEGAPPAQPVTPAQPEQAAPPPPPPPAPEPAEQPQAGQTAPVEPEAAPERTEETAEQGYNPMAFFKPKQQDDGQGE